MIELKYNFLQWFKRHHFLYLFVFLVNFKPMNPFLYDIIITTKNITQEQYREHIYPVSAYTAVITSVLVFIYLGFCGFNYVLFFTALGGLIMTVSLWQGCTILEMQVSEGFGGLALATEIVYYGSIYFCHDSKKNFGYLSAYIRVITLTGKLVSSILAQIIVTNNWLQYNELVFLGVPAYVHALLLFYHLPVMSDQQKPPHSVIPKIVWFKDKFKETFSNTHVLKWSLWAALTICGYTRVTYLMQPLWIEAQFESNEVPYNGAVDGISAFLALLAVFLTGTLTTNMRHENILLCVSSLLQSALLFGFANVESVWDSTIFYIILEILYHFAMSVVSTMIAENVHSNGRFGIAFGFIGVVYLVVNLIFVCIMNSDMVSLTIQGELMVYGCYYLMVALFMVLCWLIKV